STCTGPTRAWPAPRPCRGVCSRRKPSPECGSSWLPTRLPAAPYLTGTGWRCSGISRRWRRTTKGSWGKQVEARADTRFGREGMGMHVVVCIKQVIDPEIPAMAFRIAADQKSVERGSASLVIGPFDLNALEVAVQLKERHGARVTAVTMGGEQAREALKRALAMGADAAVLIEDAGRPTDPATVARALAAAVRKLDDVRL